MSRLRLGGRVSVTALAVLLALACAPSGPPETPREPVADTYHGVEVADDYRWLEDWQDERVRDWSEAQNAYARGILDDLPAADAIRRRLEEILKAESSAYRSLTWRGEALFAIKRQPPKQQAFLVVMPSPARPDAGRVLVDPNVIDEEGGTTIDWYVPSPDGTLVAVSLSRQGSESGDVQLFEVAGGERIDETIHRVNGGTAGGDLTWTPDGSGFFYTRYPRPGERPDGDLDFYQQVWFHRLGSSPDDDRYELGEGFARIAEIRLQTDRPTGRVLATVQEGDSGRFEHYFRQTDGTWSRVTSHEDMIVQAQLAPDGSLFLISRRDAPRGKILKLAPGATALAEAVTIVPEGDDTIVSFFYGPSPLVATAQRLYVTYQLGGPSTIRCFDHRGRPQDGPEVPAVSRVGQIAVLDGDAVLFENQSYLEPSAWYRFDPAERRTSRSALYTESPVDFSDTETVREFATSKDGTRVPVNILRPKGAPLDGTNPTLLTGYGGFTISLTPYFDPVAQVWIEHGGVLAVANLRGGGEFGEAWHRDGTLTRKQNVFDDFAAAMQHLIDRGYTTPERLAIRGGSNGGLLMGAMITQHPGLCRAVVSAVGIYDMLRVELSPNGAFNIPEYGTVRDAEQFRAMHAYSPYHHVTDGTAYPAVLFLTGANDPRVDPMQSRKMTARLQAATASDAPILLRTSSDTGHGGGTPLSARIEELTDTYAFLFHQLGMK